MAQRRFSLCLAGVLLGGTVVAFAQQGTAVERLSPDVLDVVPPSARVTGSLGSMRVSQAGCREAQVAVDAGLRRRIVDVAVQEWGFFGFGIDDQTDRTPRFSAFTTPGPAASPQRRRRRRLAPEEAARVAASIAGYWTVTAEGSWIIDRQNEAWNASGAGSRWRSPWSAAFVSWVMCASGLAESSVFQRAAAHHRYIDQAIRARDGRDAQAAFAAYDTGEVPIVPGDMLCSGRRPRYGSIAERRRQMGEGARTHCDVVVKVDDGNQRILAVGGNVRSSVTLKILPAERAANGALRPSSQALFAHLRLRAETIEDSAFDASPTVQTLGCAGRPAAERTMTVVRSLVAAEQAGTCW